jgi:TonB family protein
MRKTSLIRPIQDMMRFLCLTALAVMPMMAIAQGAGTAKDAPIPATPSDANELMLAAAKINGLKNPDLQPWHLKATYELFNEDGSTKSEGSIEELWVSATKYKVTYTSGSLSHTEYVTDKGTFTMGDAGTDPYAVFRLRQEWDEPLPTLQVVMQNKFVFQKLDTGEISAICIQGQNEYGSAVGPTWCLDRDTPSLRITANGNTEDVLHSNFISFQSRTIAQDLKFSAGELKNIASDKAAFSAHLDVIEPLTTIDDAAFVPPADAHATMTIAMGSFSGSAPPNFANPLPRPKTISISGGVAVGNLMQKVQPEYPADAKAAGISGTVVLQATIDTDGRIEDLRVVSGPPMLQQSALNAVRLWVYRPYLLNGEPIAVQTTVNVVFTLGK